MHTICFAVGTNLTTCESLEDGIQVSPSGVPQMVPKRVTPAQVVMSQVWPSFWNISNRLGNRPARFVSSSLM